MSKTPFTSFDDLDDGLSAFVNASNEAALREQVSIVNGGEKALTACPKCGGSGQTRWGRCFRCEGKGRVSVRSAAASKGAQTARENLREKQARTYASPEWAYITKRAAKGSTFYQSFIEKVETYGALTENQLAVVHRDIAKDEAFYAAKKAERIASAPVVEISAIEALFATATDNDVKKPIFRAEGVEISKAPVSGRNAGALYVKAEGEYAGKIVDGKFHKIFNAPADILNRLLAVAADPAGEAIKYGRKFGRCSICAHELVDPVSIRSGIGPICAGKWGLNYRRDAAAQELAGE